MQLTSEDAYILSCFAYMNISSKKVLDDQFIQTNMSFQDLTTYLINEKQAGHPRDFGSYGSLTNKEQYEMLKAISENKYPSLSRLKLKDYTNQNDTNGLVALEWLVSVLMGQVQVRL